jgi:hypothetical protein
MNNLRITEKKEFVDIFGTGDQQTTIKYEVRRDFTEEELRKRIYSKEVIKNGVVVEIFFNLTNAEIFVDALTNPVMDKRKEIETLLIDNFDRMNMDIPSNFDHILNFVCEDVEDSADKDNWNESDVVIGLRRFIEQIN